MTEEYTEEEIVDLVKSKPLSKCSEIDQVIEGVVCRSEPLMLYRNGNPVKFKLKCKEFKEETKSENKGWKMKNE